MYSTQEDLEPFDDNGPLLQRYCHVPGNRHLQRYFRLYDPNTSYALRLEAAHAPEEENTHDDHLCDWVLVSLSYHH